jgi:hypothetical protein
MPNSTTGFTPTAGLRASRAHKPSSATGTSPGSQRGAVRRTRSHQRQDEKSVAEWVRNRHSRQSDHYRFAYRSPNRCHRSLKIRSDDSEELPRAPQDRPAIAHRPPMTTASATEMAARRLPRSGAVQTTLHTTRPTHRTAGRRAVIQNSSHRLQSRLRPSGTRSVRIFMQRCAWRGRPLLPHVGHPAGLRR